MAAPKINIDRVTRTRISNKSGVDYVEVFFSSDQDLIEWQARADGSGVGQGLLVGKSIGTDWNSKASKYGASWSTWGNGDWNSFIIEDELSFIVEDNELTNGEKTYRINVYGKNENGEWSVYG